MYVFLWILDLLFKRFINIRFVGTFTEDDGNNVYKEDIGSLSETFSPLRIHGIMNQRSEGPKPLKKKPFSTVCFVFVFV